MTSAVRMAFAQYRLGYSVAAGVLALAAGLALLYFFSPAEYGFYPRCGLYVLTGLQCPGCGGLRAAHCMLHGDFAGAFAFNPLMFIIVPAFLTIGAAATVHKLAGRPFPRWLKRPEWLWLGVATGLGLTIVRNLL
jgi:hypothetical protein